MDAMKPFSAQQVSEATTAPPGSAGKSEAERISVYHWLVVMLAASGWLFDCMGQRIFVLSREPALRELLGAAGADDVRRWGGIATFLLMVGWATGGIVFGLLSDRYGRVKTMVATLLAYSVFSGVSGFAHTGIEFLVYRFLFGLGVGGMFGAATTLVAESVPRHFRTVALGSMQALSACGNMLASALSLKIVPGQENYWGHYSGWQVLSFVSIFPALMAIPMSTMLREPEAWKKAKALAAQGEDARSVGSLGDLFKHPRWRKNLLVGVCLGVAGMVGLWGIAFFSPELITTAFKDRPLLKIDLLRPGQICSMFNLDNRPAILALKQRLSPAFAARLAQVQSADAVPDEVVDQLDTELNRLIQGGSLYEASAFEGVNLKKGTRNLIEALEKKPDGRNLRFLNRQLLEQLFPGSIRELQKVIDETRSTGTFLQDLGALFGMFGFTMAAAYLSRRAAFFWAFALCLAVVAYVFYSLKTASDVYWMLPLMGFATLSVFAGYSIYFPEIFPTRLRGTGVGFCYNTVRYLAAPFPFLLGWLSSFMPFRQVAVMMCGIYVVGLLALLWAPETKGQPLPE